jgi:hypothetical protein
MFASPMITWSRRYFSGSAWGSSRVLMIGRLRVVSSPTSTSKNCERCAIWNDTELSALSVTRLPAPAKIWRVTRNGVRSRTIRENGVARSTRKFSWVP